MKVTFDRVRAQLNGAEARERTAARVSLCSTVSLPCSQNSPLVHAHGSAGNANDVNGRERSHCEVKRVCFGVFSSQRSVLGAESTVYKEVYLLVQHARSLLSNMAYALTQLAGGPCVRDISQKKRCILPGFAAADRLASTSCHTAGARLSAPLAARAPRNSAKTWRHRAPSHAF